MKTVEEAIRDCYPILCSQSDLEGVTFNFDQVQALMKYYAEQQAAEQDRWVAVSSGILPEVINDGVGVLIFPQSIICSYGSFEDAMDNDIEKTGFWHYSNYWDGCVEIKGVTHWQALPSPPVTKEKYD